MATNRREVTVENSRILRLVAVRTLDDARTAWRKANASPSEDAMRRAYCHAVLAARTLRRAAKVTPAESEAMLAAATRVDVEALTLRGQLVEIVERPVSIDGGVR